MLYKYTSFTFYLVCICLQVTLAAAATAAAAAPADDDGVTNDNDAKDNENELLNDTATQSTNSQPLTSNERTFPSAADESRKTPTSAGSMQALQPFGGK